MSERDGIERYEARWVPGGVPTNCCDYGVVSLARGVEVCRVWREDDARLIADLLNTRALPPAEPDEPTAEMVEAVTAAIQEADAQLHYSFNLTRLVDGEETYTLSMPGFDPVDFLNDRDEGYALLTERRNRVRAQAVIAALRAARPAGGREGGA